MLQMFICVYVCDHSSHQESQNSALSSRLTAVQEDMGKSPARKRWLWCILAKDSLLISVLMFTDYKFNVIHFLLALRSASVTNLSLDRSGSAMVPAYESSVSPQNSRAVSKTDHNEEERKILLVRTCLVTIHVTDSQIPPQLSLTFALLYYVLYMLLYNYNGWFIL